MMVEQTDYDYASLQDNPNWQKIEIPDECPICQAYLLDSELYVHRETKSFMLFVFCHKCGWITKLKDVLHLDSEKYSFLI